MGTYYSGKGIGVYAGHKIAGLEPIIEDYINGKYFNTSTHQLEVIDSPVNKYNKQFIMDLTEINEGFSTVITTEKIAIELLILGGCNKYGDTNNFWNLIKAQSGTIKYNRILKTALKKYGITKKKLYDKLVFEIDKQKERVERNRKMSLLLLEEYGFGDLLKLIEDKTGMNMCEHVQKNLIEASGLAYENCLDREERAEMLSDFEKKYVESIRELAAKNGVDIEFGISDALVKRRQQMDENKKKLREQKQAEKNSRAIDYIERDNAKLFHDITASYFDNMDRIAKEKAGYMREKLLRLGGKAWYIAVCKQTRVYYISENKDITTDIFRAGLFRTQQDGVEYFTRLNQINPEFKGYNFKVCNLVHPDLMRKNGMNPTTTDLADVSPRLSAKEPTASDKEIIKNIIVRTFGHTSDSSVGTFRMYGVTLENGAEKFVGIDEHKQFTMLNSYIGAIKAIPNSNEDGMCRKRISEYIKNNCHGVKARTIDVTFDSLWYANILNKSNCYMKNLFDAMTSGGNSIWIKKQVARLFERLEEYKRLGLSDVYFVVMTAERDSAYGVVYDTCFVGLLFDDCGNITRRRTTDASKMSIFRTVEEAEGVINKYYNERKLFCKIGRISIRNL